MSAKRGVDFLKGIAEYMVKTNSFDSVTRNVKITGGGDGRCIAELTVSKEHLNMNGALHVGLTTTIVDLVTTYALMSHPCHPGISVDLHICSLREAKEGDQLVIDAKTIKANSNLAYIECELRRKNDDAVIAKGAHTKYVNKTKAKI